MTTKQEKIIVRPYLRWLSIVCLFNNNMCTTNTHVTLVFTVQLIHILNTQTYKCIYIEVGTYKCNPFVLQSFIGFHSFPLRKKTKSHLWLLQT